MSESQNESFSLPPLKSEKIDICHESCHTTPIINVCSGSKYTFKLFWSRREKKDSK